MSSDSEDFGPQLPPKRARLISDSSSDQDEFGPMPVAAAAPVATEREELPASLALGELYERSFQHGAAVTHVAAAVEAEFAISGSRDGVVKFWKKRFEGVEFVKAVEAHESEISHLSVSGNLLATTCKTNTLCLFDVRNFTLFGKFPITQVAGVSALAVLSEGEVALAETGTGKIFFLNTQGETVRMHKVHACSVEFLEKFPGLMLSVDEQGNMEMFDPQTLGSVKGVKFSKKIETDLFALRKAKTRPVAVAGAAERPVVAVADSIGKIRIYNLLTGKISCEFSSAEEISSLALDNRGNFLLCARKADIAIFRTSDGKLMRSVGKLEESEIFRKIAWYEGPAMRKQLTDASIEAREIWMQDPLLLATSTGQNKERVFFFSTRLPEADAVRDVCNEKPRKIAKRSIFAKQAVIHTTKGDIKIELYAKEVPKTVENFCTLAKKGFYNKCNFHFVIKGMYIQTGDPTGTGQGGTSCWGRDFEDELRKQLTHQKEFTVSMANRGQPNTNNSQFLITTVADCHWLDRKNAVFGRVIEGEDVVRAIEDIQCGEDHRPVENVKILNIALLD